MKRKRYAVLDIAKGIVDRKKIVLAEFDSEEEAVQWRSKLKNHRKSRSNNPLLHFVDNPIWDFGGKKWKI